MREFNFNNRKYEISECGDLFRCAYEDDRHHRYGNKIKILHRHNKRKQIKPYIDKDGYAQVVLEANKQSKHFTIHQLVYMVYVLNLTDVTDCKCGYDFNKSSYIQINHIDGNKLNNHYANLELISLQDNIRHAVVNKLHNSQQVAKYIEIYKNGKLLKVIWKTREVCNWLQTNFNVKIDCGTVSKRARDGKEYKGFSFKYQV